MPCSSLSAPPTASGHSTSKRCRVPTTFAAHTSPLETKSCVRPMAHQGLGYRATAWRHHRHRRRHARDDARRPGSARIRRQHGEYDGRTILARPAQGSYQLFFYANGHLCFYHVNRGEGGYRPYQNDEDGFSKLYACPWTPEQNEVDLAKAVVMTLPVVGETTFAWGQFGRQIVTGSNIGGFYVFEEGQWRMLLEPNLKVSYQLYSTMAFYDRLLMGQYPTGRLFEYDGQDITDRAGWPPTLAGVSASAREAQTTVIYGGEVLVGVWPWGELWRYSPTPRNGPSCGGCSTIRNSPTDRSSLRRRESRQRGEQPMGPARHEPRHERRGLVRLHVGQRSVRLGCRASFRFSPRIGGSRYGSVYRLTMPGHLGAKTAWTAGPTTFELTTSRRRDDDRAGRPTAGRHDRHRPAREQAPVPVGIQAGTMG